MFSSSYSMPSPYHQPWVYPPLLGSLLNLLQPFKFHTLQACSKNQAERVSNFSTWALLPLPGMSFPGGLEVEERAGLRPQFCSPGAEKRRGKDCRLCSCKWKWSEQR